MHAHHKKDNYNFCRMYILKFSAVATILTIKFYIRLICHFSKYLIYNYTIEYSFIKKEGRLNDNFLLIGGGVV